jgi:hypothetical protein
MFTDVFKGIFFDSSDSVYLFFLIYADSRVIRKEFRGKSGENSKKYEKSTFFDRKIDVRVRIRKIFFFSDSTQSFEFSEFETFFCVEFAMFFGFFESQK